MSKSPDVRRGCEQQRINQTLVHQLTRNPDHEDSHLGQDDHWGFPMQYPKRWLRPAFCELSLLDDKVKALIDSGGCYRFRTMSDETSVCLAS